MYTYTHTSACISMYTIILCTYTSNLSTGRAQSASVVKGSGKIGKCSLLHGRRNDSGIFSTRSRQLRDWCGRQLSCCLGRPHSLQNAEEPQVCARVCVCVCVCAYVFVCVCACVAAQVLSRAPPPSANDSNAAMCVRMCVRVRACVVMPQQRRFGEWSLSKPPH